MLKSTTSALFIFLAFISYSQDFAPEGAIWHYSFYDINPEVTSYATIESKYDTIINDKSCMKMLEVHRHINDTISTQWHYMYGVNDSVFFYAEGEFHLLYDFNAEEGDTIVLDYFTTHDGTPLEILVDSVSYIDFEGVIKKVQHVTCIETLVIDFGPMIIEDIGRTHSMFPDYDGQITSMKWRCYEDYQNGLLLNPYDIGSWGGQNCEQIITSIEEVRLDPVVTIAPNPVSRLLTVKSKEIITEYSISSENGQIVSNGKPHEKSIQIKFDSFRPGIYFLMLSTENHHLIKKVVKL